METYIIGITGASGTIYAFRLMEALIRRDYKLMVVITEPGMVVLEQEMNLAIRGCSPEHVLSKLTGYFKDSTGLSDSRIEEYLHYIPVDRIESSIASGSFITSGMIVAPCSMSTLSGLARGRSLNLLERAADVMLKEERKLIVVPRETPLNSIHLENMLTLSKMGVSIIPAMPAFYHNPAGINDLVDFMAGKIMDNLGIEHDLFPGWK